VGRLKAGFILPTWCSPPDQLRWRDLLDLAKTAEQAGFDSLWATDHMLLESTNAELRRRAGGEVPPGAEVLPEGYMEVFSVLSALAAAMPGMGLGTLVACTGYRNPALLVKIADAIDEISDGRFTLGVGAGDSEGEHEAFGFPVENRVSRFEEALKIIRTLLREGRIDHQGEYYTIREVELLPRGPHPHGSPILIGTLRPGPRMQRLVAQYADVWNGWLAYGVSWPEAYPAERDVVDEACRKHGRESDTLEHTVGLRVLMPGSLYTPPQHERPLRGSTEEMAEALRGFAAAGVTQVHCAFSPGTAESVREFGKVLKAAGVT